MLFTGALGYSGRSGSVLCTYLTSGPFVLANRSEFSFQNLTAVCSARTAETNVDKRKRKIMLFAQGRFISCYHNDQLLLQLFPYFAK